MSRIQLHPNVSVINSLRAIGYTLEVSIADIIDNSISAAAQTIHINFDFCNSGNLKVAIIDDGIGMSYPILKQAMTLGSKDPGQKRDDNDLGRFGLGLKTATFAQCKSLTLVSKQTQVILGLRMDLDKNEQLQDWGVDELNDEEIKNLYGYELLKEFPSGTLVLWEKCDKLLDGIESQDQENHAKLYEKFSSLEKHLELVFHRWLEPSVGHKKIKILINNQEIKAKDPFARKLPATQEKEDYYIEYQKQKIRCKAYTLPHHNKCTKQEYEDNSLGDYISQQGFYIYRNRRLIVGGDWFRLYPKKELTKLTRILIDLPNTLDFEWKIDVKKSSIELPIEIKCQLKEVVERFCAPSKRTYTYRGRTPKEFSPIWLRYPDKNIVQYNLNLEHPIIKDFINDLPFEQKQRFVSILSLIANCLPKEQIFADMGSNPYGVNSQTYQQDELLKMLNDYFNIVKSGLDKVDLLNMIRTIEPFNKLEEQILDQFINEKEEGI